MSKLSDTIDVGDAGLQPFNARSLALSVMLGTHPPTLSARALVDVAEVFGIKAGTMRTALSRMTSAGDVTAVGGRYELSPRLLQRQAAQDAGRTAPDDEWDGRWHTATATADQRDLTDRRHVRAVMANARFGELRPSVWLRPANMGIPALGDDWFVVTGRPTGTPGAELVARLWDIPGLAAAAHSLIDRIDERERGRGDLPTAFSLAAEVLRFLRSEPLLPTELTPPAWPVDDLRRRYEALERDVQTMLRPILTASA